MNTPTPNPFTEAPAPNPLRIPLLILAALIVLGMVAVGASQQHEIPNRLAPPLAAVPEGDALRDAVLVGYMASSSVDENLQPIACPVYRTLRPLTYEVRDCVRAPAHFHEVTREDIDAAVLEGARVIVSLDANRWSD